MQIYKNKIFIFLVSGAQARYGRIWETFSIMALALIIFSAPALAACANPVGAAGDMVYNDSEHVMQWCEDPDWIGVGEAPYIPNAVHFDGVTDHLGPDTLSLGDSKLWSGSFWIRSNSEIAQKIIYLGSGRQIVWRKDGAADQIWFFGRNDANAAILDIRTTPPVAVSDWYHVAFSFDMSDTAKRHVYINDVASITTVLIYTDDIINFDSDYTIGQEGSFALEMFDGDMADFWFDSGTYIDLSVAANRRQFIDANGWPVDLGTDGSKATGAVPDIYLSGDTAAWHTNKGTGGGFTENGALTDAGSHPAELFGPLDGLIAWWKLDETSGTTAFDSSGNGNDGTFDTGSANYSFDTGIIDGGVTNLTVNQNNALRIAAPIFPIGANDPFTVTGWLFRNDNTNCGAVWGVTGNGHNTGKEIYLRDEGDRIEVAGDGLSSNLSQVSSAYDQSKWVLTAVTFDGTTLSMYADTTLLDSGARTIDVDDSINYFNIGSADGSCGGGILATYDDFRLYNRALSLAEITEIYDNGYPCKNPLAQRDGDMTYNTTSNVLQYCNLREWKAMSLSAGDGGAGCTNPVGVAGDTFYNSTSGEMTYCEGDAWRAIGKY